MSPLVLILAGSSDLTRPPLQVSLGASLSRPLILFLFHAQLRTAASCSINGALYCDPASSFVATASGDLTVASLIYYGGNEAASKWNWVIANRPIPSAIEIIAPRVVLPVIKVGL
jgi:hypothetical protein